MMGCDTFLMIGSGFPYAEFLPKEGQARGVQIDLDPAMLSIRYPMELNLTGDAKATLAALLPLLDTRQDTSWREEIAGWMKDWWRTLDERAHAKADPINPQLVFTELSPRLPERVILTSDSGSCANWYARDLKIRRGMMASLSGGLASMGAGVPYAIAAKFAYPDRPVIAMVGDGAMQMNNMAELITVAKYWRKWADPRFVVMVLDNQDLNQVTWEQRVMEGNPRFVATQQIPDVPYHRFAELIGLEGIYVDRPEDLGEAWDRALAATRPVVFNVRTDPEVPPLPSHISFEQARKFSEMLVKGDPEEGSLIKGTVRQVLSHLLPSE
jgi:pyruvate dehydrogenase (quinone)